MMTPNNGTEFDFLIGRWSVRHRRLATRLVGADDWQDFDGTVTATSLLGGLGNVDDNWLNLPGAPYRAVSLRTFNPESASWSIWWVDGRRPHGMDVPVTGRFRDGIGTFLAQDKFGGREIAVRFQWSRIGTPQPLWEQAFSADGGETWEPNWTMTFTRA